MAHRGRRRRPRGRRPGDMIVVLGHVAEPREMGLAVARRLAADIGGLVATAGTAPRGAVHQRSRWPANFAWVLATDGAFLLTSPNAPAPGGGPADTRRSGARGRRPGRSVDSVCSRLFNLSNT
ncbi:hypothetical protein HBB16_17310 [Pseudonocardia sp. MCCB 268]|nr:hypothetical protein [Pseudonocardia cytotoxica]